MHLKMAFVGVVGCLPREVNMGTKTSQPRFSLRIFGRDILRVPACFRTLASHKLTSYNYLALPPRFFACFGRGAHNKVSLESGIKAMADSDQIL